MIHSKLRNISELNLHNYRTCTNRKTVYNIPYLCLWPRKYTFFAASHFTTTRMSISITYSQSFHSFLRQFYIPASPIRLTYSETQHVLVFKHPWSRVVASTLQNNLTMHCTVLQFVIIADECYFEGSMYHKLRFGLKLQQLTKN